MHCIYLTRRSIIGSVCLTKNAKRARKISKRALRDERDPRKQLDNQTRDEVTDRHFHTLSVELLTEPKIFKTGNNRKFI